VSASDTTHSPLRGWLLTIVMNVGLPTATFFVLTQAAGLPDVPALLISGVWPVVEIGLTMRQQRRVDEFSVLVLIGIVVAVATTVLSDTARAVFLKDSITTGVLGLIFLATLVAGRPLTFYIGRRFATDGSRAQREWWDGLWRYPAFRKLQRQLCAAWGGALLGEAVLRAILTETLGTSPMVVVNNTVPYAVIATMIAVSIMAGRRAQARAVRLGATDVTPPLPEVASPR
jgi:intracellular septation protein A